MPDYRRMFVPGGQYFFTLTSERRAPIFCTDLGRRCFREAIRLSRTRWPFDLTAIVLLPDHLHAIWSLPVGDANYPRRWAAIKHGFTTAWLSGGGSEQAVSPSKRRHRRRGVLQRRYWEHTLRDEDDFIHHFDYIHYNAVKHGLVDCPHDWPYSSFHRYVRQGVYDRDWCCSGWKSPDFTGIADTVGE